MLGDFTICTAMFGSGARTGTAVIRKKTWLIRKDQNQRLDAVCCVAVRGTTVLASAAQRFVSSTSLAPVPSVSVSVSVSS